MMESINIREFLLKDKFEVLDLLNKELDGSRYFDWKRDEKFWHWKYDLNVFGKPKIFVAEINHQIIGSRTLWPWQFKSRGKILKAYQPGDTVVHSDYQGKQIFTRLNKVCINHIIDSEISLVFNFPNRNSLKGNLNAGWHYLAKIPWLVRPLRPFNLLTNNNNVKAISHIMDKKHRMAEDVCHKITNDNQSFKGIVDTNRIPGFFKWRYTEHPFFKYGNVFVKHGSKSAGAIFTVYKKAERKELLVADIIGHSSCSKSLFKEIIKTGKYYDVDFITVIYNNHFDMKSLWKLGFIKVRKKNMVVLPLDFSLEEKITDYNNWFVVGAMHDAI